MNTNNNTFVIVLSAPASNALCCMYNLHTTYVFVSHCRAHVNLHIFERKGMFSTHGGEVV